MNFRKIKTANNIPITTGLVVWCYLDGQPWWPALVCNRETYKPNLDPGHILKPSSENNRFLVFFNDDNRPAVQDLEFIREYTTNIHLRRQTTKLRKQIQIACEEANSYIEAQGLDSQKARYRSLDSFEVLKRGKLNDAHFAKTRSAAESSQDATKVPSVPSSGKRRASNRERLDAEGKALAERHIIEPVRRDEISSGKRRKYRDSPLSDDYLKDSKASASKNPRKKLKDSELTIPDESVLRDKRRSLSGNSTRKST
eukprot:IDg21195t1